MFLTNDLTSIENDVKLLEVSGFCFDCGIPKSIFDILIIIGLHSSVFIRAFECELNFNNFDEIKFQRISDNHFDWRQTILKYISISIKLVFT